MYISLELYVHLIGTFCTTQRKRLKSSFELSKHLFKVSVHLKILCAHLFGSICLSEMKFLVISLKISIHLTGTFSVSHFI